MYQALYRKYRPQTFDDVSGQLAVTQTLKSQIMAEKLSHAYLFTGSRGTGKTTCAKILAKAVNCLQPDRGNPCNCCSACKAIDSGSCMDVLEIDAASNNGVDNVRDLRDAAVYSPSEVRKRVYIIDEVHMLSMSAFNALLKIIEEPPEHLLFILATTELHKVPATILSRCQRFAFKRITQEDIAARLQYVSFQEDIDLTDDAARIIARLADGAMRDALSLLDQCSASVTGEVNAESVYNCLGIAGERTVGKLLAMIIQHDTTGVLSLCNRLYSDGKDVSALLDELACVIRDVMVCQSAGRSGITMLSGIADDTEVLSLAADTPAAELLRMMFRIQETAAGFRNSTNQRRDMELCLMELSQPDLNTDIRTVHARLSRLEEQIRSGAFQTAIVQQQPEQAAAGHLDAKPVSALEAVQYKDEAPAGFWQELSATIRRDLKPPVSGFFAPGEKSPVHGVIIEGQLVLECSNAFTYELLHRDEILQSVAMKAAAILQRPIPVAAVNMSAAPADSSGLQHLLEFGKKHSDVIRIQN